MISYGYSPTPRSLSSEYTRVDAEAMGDTLEQETRRLSQSEQGTDTAKDTDTGMLAMERRGLKRFWDRVNGKGRRHLGILESLKNFAVSSCKCLPSLNSLMLRIIEMQG
jgi:hypothetical protein